MASSLHNCPELPGGDLWVFGYGSLMWNPGFDYLEALPARVYGFRRALCLWSTVYRGTPDEPGLVFGLAAGGSCRGRAFRVRERDRETVLQYLWQREMVRRAYLPTALRLHMAEDVLPGLAFVVDTRHPQFAQGLNDEEMAAIIERSRGKGGYNREYFLDSIEHLELMGISIRPFENIRSRLRGNRAPSCND